MHDVDDEGSLVPLFLSVGATLAASTEALLRSTTRTLDLESSEGIVRRWRRRIFRAGDHTIDVEGRENVEHGRAYLVMSNHRSLLDIPAVLAAFPTPIRTLSPVLSRLGFLRDVDDARERLREGISVWLAPEGRRFHDGALHDFRRRTFELALDLGVPIVPMWIEGTDQNPQARLFALPAQAPRPREDRPAARRRRRRRRAARHPRARGAPGALAVDDGDDAYAGHARAPTHARSVGRAHVARATPLWRARRPCGARDAPCGARDAPVPLVARTRPGVAYATPLSRARRSGSRATPRAARATPLWRAPRPGASCGAHDAPCGPCRARDALVARATPRCLLWRAHDAPCGAPDAPCRARRPVPRARRPCGAPRPGASCGARDAPCGARHAPCRARRPVARARRPCGARDAPCGARHAPCRARDAPCGARDARVAPPMPRVARGT